MTATPPNIRFREARERRGLSADEVAESCGVQPIDVWEIEGLENDLEHCYSPKMLQKFCHILGIRPIELFADDMNEPPVSADDLVQLIRAECRSRGVTLGQFEDIVEWQLSSSIEPPEKLLEVMTLFYLQRLCQELQIDWRRVILSL
ncbi:MAG TPA: helix-turn-helix transcriptional regulator [Verrucomicrobiae bacterium]|nr:helix-turn-helix transcriptional regulator [Verrucomicrobiae bacterium]